MSNNKIAIIILGILAIAVGVYYYHHYNNVETLDEYILVKIQPPTRQTDAWGTPYYSDPKINVEKVMLYGNEKLTIQSLRDSYKQNYEFYMQCMEEELAKDPATDKTQRMISEAKIDNCRRALNEMWTLVKISHTRSFNAEEAIQLVLEHWGDASFENYAKSKKLKVEIIQIN